MPAKSRHPELSHTCAHPGCCSHEAVGDSPAGGLPEQPGTKPEGLWGSLKRYVLWFLAFSGIYASTSVCPFCGNPGCPVGAGGAAVVGGVFAWLWQYGKSARIKLTGFIAKGSR